MKRNRNAIYGFMAIWILLFHIGKHVGYPDIPIIKPLLQMGNCGVDVFLFISGYCTWKSYDRDKSTASFYKRRFKRIAVPYLLFAVPFYCWNNFIEKPHKSVFLSGANCLLDITQLNFFRTGMQTSWYVAMIALMYLLLPLLYKLEKRFGKIWQGCLFLFAVYVLEAVLIKTESLQHIAIAYTRFPSFILGTLYAVYEKDLLFVDKKWFKTSAILFLAVFSIIAPIKSLTNNSKIVWSFYILLIPGLIFTLSFIFSKSGFLRKMFSYCGNFSLEIYIIHVFIIRLFKYYGIFSPNRTLWYLFIPIVTAAMILIMKKIIQWCNHGKKVFN